MPAVPNLGAFCAQVLVELPRCLALLVVLLLSACGGADQSSSAPPRADGATETRPGDADPVIRHRPDEGEQDPITGRHRSPLVIGSADVEGLPFPLRVITADGSEFDVGTSMEFHALLEETAAAEVKGEPAIAYVRVFYATDRGRETPGWALLLSPLWPGLLAVAAAVLLARQLKRWLREDARRVARVVGLVALAAGGSVLARGVIVSVEMLRTSSATDVLYGSRRSPDGGLEYGTVVVSIPAQRHEVARIEMPSLLRGELFPDPLRHFAIDRVTVQGREEFFDALGAKVESAPERDAFVFVHGYNNSFVEAAMRVAQIAYDVGFEGAPILYSWPSKSAAALYTYDRENADWSAGNLAGFLTDLQVRSGAARIHLLAHSMGARVLAAAMPDAVADGEASRELFVETILAAPDLDADTFRRFIAPRLMARTGRLTLYASDRDEALIASVQVNGQRRAGMAGAEMVILDGMDTVDVTQVAGGHAYISDSGRVLVDLVDIVQFGRRAEERDALAARESERGQYWEMVRD